MKALSRTILITVMALLARVSAFAQDAVTSPDMASELRRSGKIYVVVLVLATIFAGIIAFLIYLERRMKRIEQEVLRRVVGGDPDSYRDGHGDNEAVRKAK